MESERNVNYPHKTKNISEVVSSSSIGNSNLVKEEEMGSGGGKGLYRSKVTG